MIGKRLISWTVFRRHTRMPMISSIKYAIPLFLSQLTMQSHLSKYIDVPFTNLAFLIFWDCSNIIWFYSFVSSLIEVNSLLIFCWKLTHPNPIQSIKTLFWFQEIEFVYGFPFKFISVYLSISTSIYCVPHRKKQIVHLLCPS